MNQEQLKLEYGNLSRDIEDLLENTKRETIYILIFRKKLTQILITKKQKKI